MNEGRNLELQIKQIIVETLELSIAPEEIPDDELLFGEGMGADSMTMLKLVMGLEEHLGIQVEDEDLRAEFFASVKSIADFARDKVQTAVAV